MSEINNDEVICPACCHQFVAVPVNVQKELSRLKDALLKYGWHLDSCRSYGSLKAKCNCGFEDLQNEKA